MVFDPVTGGLGLVRLWRFQHRYVVGMTGFLIVEHKFDPALKRFRIGVFGIVKPSSKQPRPDGSAQPTAVRRV